MDSINYLIEFYSTQIWAVRALIAASTVGLMCGVLGCFVVLRNMSLIGDALSHAVLPGVVLAYIVINLMGQWWLCEGLEREDCGNLLETYHPIGFFLGSTLAALLAAVVITWLQKNIRTENDAAIGIVFTLMFAIGVIGISQLSKNHGVHLDLTDMLVGNMMGVSNEDLWINFIVASLVIASVLLFYRSLFATTFQPIVAEVMGIKISVVHYLLMLVLSFVVVASIRTVGVILVVAMLVTPASTALLLSNRLERVIIISGLIGILSSSVGMSLAILLNTPPGPFIVIVCTIFYLLAAAFAPKKGFIPRMLTKRRKRLSNDS